MINNFDVSCFIYFLNMAEQQEIVPNPDVIVPEGNFKNGKALFDDLCRSCHKMRVSEK